DTVQRAIRHRNRRITGPPGRGVRLFKEPGSAYLLWNAGGKYHLREISGQSGTVVYRALPTENSERPFTAGNAAGGQLASRRRCAQVEFSLRHVRNYKLGRVEKPRANEPLISTARTAYNQISSAHVKGAVGRRTR